MSIRTFSRRRNGPGAGVIDRRTAALAGAVPPASFVLGYIALAESTPP